jgi:hypothetical protein
VLRVEAGMLVQATAVLNWTGSGAMLDMKVVDVDGKGC